MTEHHDPLDELASAHLDGQTSADEAARIAADPDLTARVLRMAEVRDAVGTVTDPVDATRRDRAIDAALAAFVEADLPTSAGAPAPGVTTLVPHAARRRARRTIQLVGVAAALVLVALLVPLLDRLDSGSNSQQAARVPDASSLTDTAAGAADSATTTRGFAPSTGPMDLGPFTALPDLAAAVRSQVDASPAMEAGPTLSGGASEPSPRPCIDGGTSDGARPVLYSAWATLDGRAVVVVVREEPAGERTMLVLDRNDCHTVTSGTL